MCLKTLNVNKKTPRIPLLYQPNMRTWLSIVKECKKALITHLIISKQQTRYWALGGTKQEVQQLQCCWNQATAQEMPEHFCPGNFTVMERDSWPRRAAVLILGEVKITHAEGQHDLGALHKSDLFKLSLMRKPCFQQHHLCGCCSPCTAFLSRYFSCLLVTSCPILPECKKTLNCTALGTHMGFLWKL